MLAIKLLVDGMRRVRDMLGLCTVVGRRKRVAEGSLLWATVSEVDVEDEGKVDLSLLRELGKNGLINALNAVRDVRKS